ncbi:unnamed protein product [Caenorhabditis angaria]|uniref:DNA polymerase epsilon subunit 3 n=1 Tax=Caenorhabditis angaria TaxID=860376 RepID=A0A9P1N1S4_9PELO|nr:unnamed protein product [Caenorhabditis angaria]
MDDKIGSMNLPQAVVGRLLKEEDISASKESRETISRAAAVFLINLSGLAVQNAKENKHKTISADDVLKALRTFDNNTIYSQCKQAVDEWKIIKQQKSLAKSSESQETQVSQIFEETME